ncbi:MAG: TIGR03936 family radical SAM-associated protein, partial [Acidimicrobiia bacterium]|nr:TIGR03936 family radical SAM-associated protein [Acidimicrobiia bacterium]
SLGFSPRPKVSLGLALGVGHESDGEYLDLELAEPIAVEALPATLTETLPVGVEVIGAVALVPRAPALQEAITSVEYDLRPAGLSFPVLHAAVEQAMGAEHLPIETTRKGRAVVEDLRPGLRRLELRDDVVEAEVATQPRGIRPAELIGALRGLAATAIGSGEDRVLRTHQWIERDGARQQPLEADRAPRASDDVRAPSKGLINARRDDDRGGGDRADTRDHGADAQDHGADAQDHGAPQRRIA